MNEFFHVGRPVNVRLLSDATDAHRELAASCLMLVAESGLSESAFRAAVQQLAHSSPLAIALGPGTRGFFDALLDCVSREAGPVIMTKTLDGNLAEAVDEFLVATWPSEDRFDDWQRYTVVALNNRGVVDEVIRQLQDRS
jgi:hypothetical protein